MIARIKPGAIVGIDFAFGRWPQSESDREFTATVQGDRATCRAPGYGERGSYGNGAVHVRAEDLVPLSEPPWIGEGI